MNALGWAYEGVGSRLHFGTKSFSAFKDDYGIVFHEYEKWLIGMIRNCNPDVIAVEATNAGLNGKARYIITAMEAITHKVAASFGIQRSVSTPSQIKKWLTGKGNADKALMVSKAKELGYKVTDDNQADAVALLLLTKETTQNVQQPTTGPAAEQAESE